MQRRAELEAALDDLRLSHTDDGSFDGDVCLGLRANIEHFLKGVVKLRSTVGVSGRVLRDCADVD